MAEAGKDTGKVTRSRSNARMAVLLSGLVAGMVALSFASVPLYQLFCQVTGYGGTTQVAEALPAEISDRVMHIRFNADVIGGLPWSFQPAQREVSVNVGESGLAFYKAKNLSKKAVTGVAVFNVTPLKAGQYFQKIQCFCFDEQTLAGGQQVDMPVSYFVDPAINDDPNLDDVRTITLSYTFFSVEEDNGEEQEEELSALPGNGEGEAVKQASLD